MEKRGRAVSSALDTLKKALDPTSVAIIRMKLKELQRNFWGKEFVERDLTAASNTYEDLTKKLYEAGSRVDELLEPAPVPPT